VSSLSLLHQLKTRVWGEDDPDFDLVEAAQRGDRRAFDSLIRSHEVRLRGFLARRVGPEAAEDLLQETLLASWMALSRFDRRSRFKAWLYGIAMHKVGDFFRARGRAQPEVPLSEVAASWQTPEALYAAAELRETVRQLLEQLPGTQREVVELYYYAELTLAEIARLLGRNLNTVKYQFYRAHTLVERGLHQPAPPLRGELGDPRVHTRL
jgi:RNA polymerase sigma-70 factor, ECF subfamily